MKVTELQQNRNMLHVKFSLPNNSGNSQTYVSPEYAICGLVLFRAKSYYLVNEFYCWQQIVMIELKKQFESDTVMYSINLTSTKMLNKSETYSCSENNCWQIYKVYAGDFRHEFDMDLILDISSSTSRLFSTLRDDSNLTDFELRGDDGSVKVHKTILAGLSPFIKTLLENSGQWDEVTSNSVNVPNATQGTLEHLKDYIYLQKMPDTGIVQLAELASFFLMSDLEQRCAAKLIATLCQDNVIEYLEIAMKYKIRLLLLAILNNVKFDIIKISDLDRQMLDAWKIKE